VSLVSTNQGRRAPGGGLTRTQCCLREAADKDGRSALDILETRTQLRVRTDGGPWHDVVALAIIGFEVPEVVNAALAIDEERGTFDASVSRAERAKRKSVAGYPWFGVALIARSTNIPLNLTQGVLIYGDHEVACRISEAELPAASNLRALMLYSQTVLPWASSAPPAGPSVRA
jgi:hypothetical protein